MREVRQAMRRLVRAPSFTLPALLTLALAIGLNAAIFTLVLHVVLAPLPYRQSDRLVALDHGATGMDRPSGIGITTGLYVHYLERAQAFESIALHTTFEMTVSGDLEAERVMVTAATPSLMRVLGLEPSLGRWFSEEEGVVGGPRAVVLSHGLWQRRYGRDAGVIGRSLRIAGEPAQIVGVMPAGFRYPDDATELWLSLPFGPPMVRAGGFNFQGVARLRDGVTIEAVRGELDRLIAQYPDRFPEDGVALMLVRDGHLASTLVPLKDLVVGSMAETLWILLGAVGVALLVACANVANLFLVRLESRLRDVAVRRALGAGRHAVTGYFLGESALLAVAGGVLGLALAAGGVHLLGVFGPRELPRLHEVRIDAVVVAFTLGLSLLVAIVFGSIPLLRGMPSLAKTLYESGRGNTSSAARMRARHLLMGGQVALALVLLVAAALLGRSFQRLLRVDPGFDARSALVFNLGLPQGEFATNQARSTFHRQLIDRVTRLPGVRSAGVTTCPPLEGLCNWDPLIVVGRPEEPGRIPPITNFINVGEDYFDVLGVRRVAGRVFEAADFDHGGTAVIDERLARLYFPNENPIGKRVAHVAFSDQEFTIIGVVRHVAARSLSDSDPPPEIYMPLLRGPDHENARPVGFTASFIVRSATPPLELAPAIRREIAQLSPNVAMARVRTLESTLAEARAPMAFNLVLLGTASAVALVLGLVGIYGVIAYAVAQRTGEIGVRMALGARPRDIAGMVMAQGGAVAIVGVVVGILAALAVSDVMRSLLFGVSPVDPLTYSAVAAGLLAVALIACWMPARRAARLDPTTALRSD
ncbi:MAG: ABC transporter permease [Longimicrobiales bacterium]